MSRSDVVYAIAIGATTAVWLLIVGAVRAVRQPREPEHFVPTLELGPEPPALAGFLAGNFRVRRDAVPATSPEVRAWLVRRQLYTGLEQGQVVTARVTPRLGYVHSIRPAPAV